MKRHDGRRPDALRPTAFARGVNPYAEGSCLVTMGQTKVLVTATVEESIPRWLQGRGKGWVTAEYAMLPRANRDRTPRERAKVSGRTHEIQRLVGRALRAVTDLEKLGERQIVIDCDVLHADGGTRCAAINGAYVALRDAIAWCRERGKIAADPVVDSVAAVSCGLVDGRALLDLDYEEDSGADVDANFVMTGSGRLVEVQMTGEEATFAEDDIATLLALARTGVRKIARLQKSAPRSDAR